MFAQEPALFVRGRRIGVELVDELLRAFTLFGKRLSYRLDLGHERGVVGYDLAYITLRRLYLSALGQRCGSVRRI